MYLCPRCRRRLARTRAPDGICFECPDCQGRAVSLAVVRRVVDADGIKQLWSRVIRGQGKLDGACPICSRQMLEAEIPANGESLHLDVCAGCRFLWLDAHEFEGLPRPPHSPTHQKNLPAEVREQMALADLRVLEMKDRKGEYGSAPPDEAWKWVPALLGMPVEHEVNPIKSYPWFTWILVGLMAITFALTFGETQEVAELYGLVPAEALRYGGLTLLTSFFLHGGLFHLIGNSYFLLIFGDNVEDDLGHARYLLLLAAATVCGHLLHIAGETRGLIPCIGASGGISGIIVYYALRYPRARLGLLIRYWFVFSWFYLPAFAALITFSVLRREVARIGYSAGLPVPLAALAAVALLLLAALAAASLLLPSRASTSPKQLLAVLVFHFRQDRSVFRSAKQGLIGNDDT